MIGIVLLIGLIAMCVTAIVAPTSQAACEGIDCVSSTINKTQSTTGNTTDVDSLAKQITNVLLYLVGGIAVIMISYGGVQYITSAGDGNKTKAARDTILYGVIGLAVAMAAWALATFVIGKL